MFRQSIEFVYGIDCNYIEDDGHIGINNQIRKWKANFLIMNNGKVEDSGSLEFPDLTNEKNCIIIKLEDTTREQYEELERQKQQRKQKFSRSKVKRETQQMIDELFYEDDEEFIEEEDER